MPRKKAELLEEAMVKEESIVELQPMGEEELPQPQIVPSVDKVQESTVLIDLKSDEQLEETISEDSAVSPDLTQISQEITEDKLLDEKVGQEVTVPESLSVKNRRAAPKKKVLEPEPPQTEETVIESAEEPNQQLKRRVRGSSQESAILTIASGGDVDTPETQEETAWHEIRNAYRTHRILTGTLSGLEPTENGKPIAIANYNGYRVVIPLSEMMINLSSGPNHYGEMQTRQSKILGSMIGAEIDFVIKGIESKSRSIVASRKDAMMRKRKLFYFETDAQGMYRIYEGRIVQARVIAVAEKVVRVEAFGVECPIPARDLSYDWLGDARERYHVGDEILIRIQKVSRESVETLLVQADVKSIAGEADRDNLKKCRIQGKYVGTVTDIHRGVVFVRLGIGVNAVAHSCFDNKTPMKKDDVSFAVTHLDEERNVAVGIITRIMRHNL